MQKITFSFLFSFFLTFSFSQEYFQQQVDYKIDVKLNEATNSLNGFITIDYTNNSPDTLEFLYFHLWANAYKNNKTRLARQMAESGNTDLYFDYQDVGGYIDSLNFLIETEKISWDFYKNEIDIAKLRLNQALLPGEKITITTPFYVKIPSGDISRLGCENNNYQITQWFPKPAVYDNSGWHQFSYLQYGEFYSEFGSFDVTIEVPKQYVIAATGELQNPEEKQWLSKLANSNKIGDEIENPEKKEYKKIRFVAENVHDFAWFASKKYLVEQNEVILPYSKSKVTTWTMYFDDNKSVWQGSTQFINDALYFYSYKVGDYPYKNCTAVQGALKAGGGMEYPMITVISADSDKQTLENVIMHEVGHNWFYGVLGFNERDFPYLDEGINSFYEMLYLENKYPNKKAHENLGMTKEMIDFFELGIKPLHFADFLTYVISEGVGIDASIDSETNELDMIAYYTVVYKKAAAAFYYLMSYIGVEEFDEIMKKFYQEWKYKHPQPEDIRCFFEEKTEEDLSWFFDELLGTTKKVDYKIKKSFDKNLVIINKGQISAPICFSFVENDKEISQNWIKPTKKKTKISIDKTSDFDYIIDYNYLTFDYNKTNNYCLNEESNKKLKLKFLTSLTIENNIKINYLPAFGYNYTDKLLAGIFLHNFTFPKRRFQYKLMSIFSLKNGSPSGIGVLKYELVKSENFDIDLGAKFKSFTRTFISSNNIYNQQNTTEDFVKEKFFRLKIYADFELKTLKNYHRRENHLVVSGIITNSNQTAYEVKYQYFHKSALNPFNFEISAMEYTNFNQIYSLETNYLLRIYKENSLQIRFFGSYLTNTYDESQNSMFPFVGVSGSSSYEDFVFDNFFIGRSRNIIENPGNMMNHQFINNNGGFGLYSPFGAKSQYLTSLNLKFNISKTPFRPYFNIAFYENSGKDIYEFDYFDDSFSIQTQKFAYECGISIAIVRDKLEIYFPIYASKDIWDYNNKITEKYFQKVRFLLNFSGGSGSFKTKIMKLIN